MSEKVFEVNHRQTVVLPCVNGDMAIQWEWSHPSQNQTS